MNRLKSWLAISVFSLLVLGIPAIASAQYRDRDRNDPYGGYGNNGGYNNGGYGNGQYGGDMRYTVRSLKQRARDFQRQLDRDLDNSRYNGSRREDDMNDLAKDFKKAVDRLDNDERQNSNEVRRVLELGSQIDRSIGRARLSYEVQNIWSSVRRDLQTLGYGSGYNNNNRGNRNGGYGNGNGNGNGRRNLPSWWPF